MFTVWSDNGHTTRHGTAQTFADSLCGNGKCDNNNEYCGLSTTDCSQINTGSCSNITGCILKNTTIESCTGTTFSCSSIGDKTTCNDIGCYWDATNTCAKPAANKETCESLNTTQCNVAIQNNISDCTSASYTIENCKGTITTPENESDCTTLNNISFALTTKRYPEYIEDTTSCPADCSMPSDPRCGNGTCDSSAAKCSMSTTDCSKLDTSTCP